MKKGGREENDYSCKVNDEDDETTWCRQGKSLGFFKYEREKKKETNWNDREVD